MNRPLTRNLFTPYMLLGAWLPAAAITALHYTTGPEYHWLHDVLRRLYYLPILLASFSTGLRGGLALAGVVAVAYSPHAFTHLAHQDPAHTLEKVLELVLYLVMGGVAGMLVDRERRRQGQLTSTAQKLRESLEEQRRTTDQLIRTGRLAALGELVAGIAHEIKNPLHALRGTAEVVDPVVPKDAPQRRMWELHVRELDRLDTVAERFLSFARPTPPDPREVDLLTLVERTQDLVSAQAGKLGVELEVVQPAEGAAARVQADGQQLTQVLLNISLNALQAVGEREQGTIRYSLSSQQRDERTYHVISVANNGPAIPGEDLERIFDPFVTTKSDGAGLGLSIASRIMEAHGGHIKVSNAGEWVTFELLLPA